MRVLIVEDSNTLGLIFRMVLLAEGHEVRLAVDPAAAMAQASAHKPDLVVLDLSHIEEAGNEVLTSLRHALPDIPVMVIVDQRSDCIQSLDMGADDCLIKPFSLPEFMARCRALLRKRLVSREHRLSFNGVDVNQVDHSVSYNGEQVDLTTQESKVLACAVQLQGKRVSHSELVIRLRQVDPLPVPRVDIQMSGAVAGPGQRSEESKIVQVGGVGYRVQCTCHTSKGCLVHYERHVLTSTTKE
jgi:DNA-binding response OmpR family regulator